MTGMQYVEVKQRVGAPRERVWAVYTDYPGWGKWAGIGRVAIEREGNPPPFGPGCIRVVTGGGREEIVTAEPPARMSYRVVSGLPLREHLGEVELIEHGADGQHGSDGAGTIVTWRCRFKSAIPGTGTLFRLIIGYVFRRALRGLARHVERQTL